MYILCKNTNELFSQPNTCEIKDNFIRELGLDNEYMVTQNHQK